MPANSSWRKIVLQGGAPWGFRLTDSKNQIQPGLQISKVRTRSNAYMAGLRDNDIILSINEIPTHSMSLQLASDFIDSCQSLQLTVLNSSYNQNNDVNEHNFVNENQRNHNYNRLNSNVISELGEEEGEKEQKHYRDHTPSLSNASITKLGENQSYNSSNRVLKNQTFNKFSTGNTNNFNQQQQPIYRKPFYDYNTNMRRSYFSATESCGEDTDVDDSMFGYNNPSKQSYASIKLRAPLKDVNYYSDTETSFPTNSSRNFFKQQEQKFKYNSNNNIKPPVIVQQQPQPKQIVVVTSPPSIPKSLNKYQQSTAKPFIPTNAAVSVYNNKHSFSLLNRQAKPFVNQQQSTDNPYSPSPLINAGSNFKVPNIYDKLNPQKSSFTNFDNNYQQLDNDDYFKNNSNNNTNQIENYQTLGEQEDLEFQKYESEMGTELMKHSEKPNYSDSYFYNNPSVNYPTIDDQKRLARVIASTLEGSDPNTSKFHKYKKKQSFSEQNDIESFDAPSEALNFNESIQNSMSNNVFVHDQNLPDVIRKSIALAERIDPVRQVYATDEFKKNHYTKHTTHTEANPQAAMSLAAALQIGVQSRGAQIFQKRKAKSEKWVVDEQTVSKPAFSNFIAPAPVKFNPPPEPVVSVPMPQVSQKQFVLAQKYEENQQNKFSDFNNKPRGWNSGDSDRHQSVARSIHPHLSIDQSIREGIEELHFSNEPQIDLQPTPTVKYIEPVKTQQENKTFAMSKDGIQMIKDRLLAEREEQTSIQNFDSHKPKLNRFYEPVKLNLNENFTPVPTISKVKLNKLNTSDFFTNAVPRSYVSPSFSFLNTINYHDDNIATSDL